jgi:Effector-associated domain 1
MKLNLPAEGGWRGMGGEQMAALTGPQLGNLSEALLDAYIGRDDFEMLLKYKLDRDFSALVGDGNLKVCVFRLLRVAQGQGWLDELIREALKERPGNVKLVAWVQAASQKVNVPVSPPEPVPPSVYQLLNSVYFDLNDLRRAVARAKRSAGGKVIGFGVTYPEGIFVSKLCDWLAYYIGETQHKDPLNLMPEIAPVSQRLRTVARYKRDLDSTNVLCVVYVQGVPVESIVEFWDGVRRTFEDCAHYLLLVFTGYSDTVFPEGISALPPPQFDLFDVDVWTHEMVRLRGWPPELASAWTDLLRDESMQNDVLIVRDLYEAMDRSIKEVLFRPDTFRRELEERTGGAFETSA